MNWLHVKAGPSFNRPASVSWEMMAHGRRISPHMIRLRTFGAVNITGEKGTDYSSVLARPKILALLSYLAGNLYGLDKLLDL